MTLKKTQIQRDVYYMLRDVDEESAQQMGVEFESIDEKGKRAMRWVHAKHLGKYLFELLTLQAMVQIPNHNSNAAMTGPGGGPPHTHPSNMGPISHKRGKII